MIWLAMLTFLRRVFLQNKTSLIFEYKDAVASLQISRKRFYSSALRQPMDRLQAVPANAPIPLDFGFVPGLQLRILAKAAVALVLQRVMHSIRESVVARRRWNAPDLRALRSKKRDSGFRGRDRAVR